MFTPLISLLSSKPGRDAAAVLECTKLLLKAKADPNIAGGERHPLQSACEDHPVDVLRLLVEHKVDVNVKFNPSSAYFVSKTPTNVCSAEFTALYLTALSQKLAHMDVLLAAGARLRSRQHFSPLHAVIFDAKSDVACEKVIARLLKAPNASEVLDRGIEYSYNPLTEAAERGYLRTVKLLVESKANVNYSPSVPSGNTALHCALEKGHLAVAKFLVSAGACTHHYLCKGGKCHFLGTS